MKTYFVIILGVLTAAMVIASCDEDTLLFDPFDQNVKIDLISDSTTATCQADPFEIVEIERKNEVLNILVAYSGGCTDHEFTLTLDKSFLNKNHPELKMILTHNANGDLCEAYPSEMLSYNLKEIIGGQLHDDLSITIEKCQ